MGPPTWKDRILVEKFPMFVAYFMDKLLKLVSVEKLELLIPKFKETLWSSKTLLVSVAQH